MSKESKQDVPTCVAVSALHRTRPHPANPTARPNEEARRRADVVRFLPDEVLLPSPDGVVLEQNDECSTRRRCMQVGAFSKIGTGEAVPVLSIWMETA